MDIRWLILPPAGRASVPVVRCIKYGDIPSGFGGTIAYPLVPDRYFVEVHANGEKRQAHFTLRPDGGIDVWRTTDAQPGAPGDAQ